MKLFTTLLTLSAFCFNAYAGNSTQVLKRIDQLEGAYAAKSSVKIGLFEESTQGWATYADAAGATPVNGTGGAPTVTFTRSTSSPLEGKASAILTKDAANRQGEGASYDFTIDEAYSGANPQNLTIEFYYETGGTFTTGASSDVQVYVYDITNATLITPLTTSISATSGRFQSAFLAATGSVDYRLIFHVATTSASAWTLKVDKVSVHELPVVYNTTGASSVALLTTGNGFGSTNTNIRRYTVTSTQGTAISCTDSATLGTSCTVNQDGIYAVNRLDRNTGAASNFGVVKNDDCTTGGFDSVVSANQVSYTMAASNVAVNAPNPGVALSSGDILRACDDSSNRANDTNSRTSRLTIAKVRDEALPSSFIVATGGTITTDGNYRVHTFNSSGSFQITSGSGMVESLVVAGGGAGGNSNAAGGGAGGLIYTTPGATYGTGTYTVTVGAGGTGVSTGTSGNNGGNSVFDTITATGGGGGGANANAGNNGGSGGGGGGTSGGQPGGTGIAGQGFAGGTGVDVINSSGGGGGGCGSVGGNAAPAVGGNGGTGCSNSITGSAVFYASGGGGSNSFSTQGTASAGGGANGAASAASNATANTGGGGGGRGDGAGTSGAGGSGVVILRYQFQ